MPLSLFESEGFAFGRLAASSIFRPNKIFTEDKDLFFSVISKIMHKKQNK
jgi:hypothetical protein